MVSKTNLIIIEIMYQSISTQINITAEISIPYVIYIIFSMIIKWNF